MEDVELHGIAFQVGLCALEMPRAPAASKALEVKLAYQETELATVLRRIRLGSSEMSTLRERAERLREGRWRGRGDAHLPLTLATFVYEALSTAPSGAGPRQRSVKSQPSDEKLAFEAAVSALGWKNSVSEAEHPLLVEGQRRQRGELAVTLLVNHKDNATKLEKVMDKILDREVHPHYKAQPQSMYLCGLSRTHVISPARLGITPVTEQVPPARTDPEERSSSTEPEGAVGGVAFERIGPTVPEVLAKHELAKQHLAKQQLAKHQSSSRDTDSSAVEDDDYEMKLRFMTLDKANRRTTSGGMASIDSSAPETTSSDNSPTVVRKMYSKHGVASDSSMACSDDEPPGTKAARDLSQVSGILSADQTSKEPTREPVARESNREPTVRDADSPSNSFGGAAAGNSFRYNTGIIPFDSRSSTPALKSRYKGKTKVMPSEPNQPSEALSHFLFTLSKTVLNKAGGSSSTSMFTQPAAGGQHAGPHRALHLCAFQIGLYALGIHNLVSPNWLSRTYSMHVSWITGQAMEIGSCAVKILIDTWEGHLTPAEAANLADRASNHRDPGMIYAAAKLSLDCLPHAHALNPNEIQRALGQCREQEKDMLEQACHAVESAARDGGVYPEVLFDVARRWYDLYEESLNSEPPVSSSPRSQHRVSPTEQNRTASLPAVAPSPESRASPTVLAQPQAPVIPQYLPQAAPVLLRSYLPPRYPQMGNAVLMPSLQAAQLQNFAYIPPQQQILPHAGYASYVPSQLIRTHAPATPAHTTAQPHTTTQTPEHQIIVTQTGMVSQVQLPEPAAPSLSPTQMHYLLCAYRVGMLALDTLARRVHDVPASKFARNPPHGEDVKWLLHVACKLGVPHVQQFCASVTSAVMSPFVLQNVCLEVAQFLARGQVAHIPQHLRGPTLAPVVQRCLQMFMQCAQQRLHHIQPSEFDEYVSIICSARNAFCMSTNGMVSFNELLNKLRRSKNCKHDLWSRIMNGLSSGGTPL